MITIFKVRNKIGYYKNIHKFCENGSFFTYIIVQTDIRTDRQTNFKLLHGNTVNNSITIKKKPKKYGNQSTRSKVMNDQRFKKHFDVAL